MSILQSTRNAQNISYALDFQVCPLCHPTTIPVKDQGFYHDLLRHERVTYLPTQIIQVSGILHVTGNMSDFLPFRDHPHLNCFMDIHCSNVCLLMTNTLAIIIHREPHMNVV